MLPLFGLEGIGGTGGAVCSDDELLNMLIRRLGCLPVTELDVDLRVRLGASVRLSCCDAALSSLAFVELGAVVGLVAEEMELAAVVVEPSSSLLLRSSLLLPVRLLGDGDLDTLGEVQDRCGRLTKPSEDARDFGFVVGPSASDSSPGR